jgi:hypothetical protein
MGTPTEGLPFDDELRPLTNHVSSQEIEACILDYIPCLCIDVHHHAMKRHTILLLDAFQCIDVSKVYVEKHVCRESYDPVFTTPPLM